LIFRRFNITKKKQYRLVFIYGCPRSGTTWLWSMLETHSDVLPFTDGGIKDSLGKYETSESGVYIRNSKTAKKKILDFVKRNKNKLIIEKTPSHTLRYSIIKRDFPNSKGLVILRNPLAIVNSMLKSKMKAFGEYDLEYSVKEVKKYFIALRQILHDKSNHVVSYENLIQFTKVELADVMLYLDLNTNEIDNIISSNKGKTKVKVEGLLRKGLIDSYKEDLSVQDQMFIREQLKEEILFFRSYTKNAQ